MHSVPRDVTLPSLDTLVSLPQASPCLFKRRDLLAATTRRSHGGMNDVLRSQKHVLTGVFVHQELANSLRKQVPCLEGSAAGVARGANGAKPCFLSSRLCS